MEANRRRATELLALVRRRLDYVAEAFYDIGAALIELSKAPVYGALGYSTFDDLLDKEKLMGRSAAYELLRIAENLTRQDALRLGKEKAHAIIQYVAATKQVDNAHELVVGGQIEGKSIEALAAADLERMARRRRKPAKTNVSPIEAAKQKSANAAAGTLQAWLRRRGAKEAVANADCRDGVWWIEVRVKAECVTGIVK